MGSRATIIKNTSGIEQKLKTKCFLIILLKNFDCLNLYIVVDGCLQEDGFEPYFT